MKKFPDVRIKTIVLFIFVAVPISISCSKEPGNEQDPANSAEQPIVHTTFYPTYYFTKRIGGSFVSVRSRLPEAEDPRQWMPDRETIGKLQKADLIIMNGANLEKWRSKVSLPRNRVVVTATPFKSRWIQQKTVKHRHGPEGKHSHSETDPHTWLSPELAILQAKSIFEALKKNLPEKTTDLRDNYLGLKKELEALDQKIKSVLSKHDTPLFVASHPSYDYVEASYPVRIENVHLDPESKPAKETEKKLQNLVESNDVAGILWERPPADSVRSYLKKTFQLRSVVFRPLENPKRKRWPEENYFLNAMTKNVNNLQNAIKKWNSNAD